MTYIRTIPEKLWTALTTPEFMKKYWFGMNFETDWRVGSPWKLIFPDGRIADAGEIVEFDKPRRLVLKWRNQFRPELHEEGYARSVIEIEPAGDVVKLTITHEIDKLGSEAHRCGFHRLAENPVEPQDFARNRNGAACDRRTAARLRTTRRAIGGRYDHLCNRDAGAVAEGAARTAAGGGEGANAARRTSPVSLPTLEHRQDHDFHADWLGSCRRLGEDRTG